MLSENDHKMQRVLSAVAMNPERFATFEEQIFMLTGKFKANNELYLPLFICDNIKGTPPIYATAGLPAECLDLHHFSIKTLLRLLQILRDNKIDLIHWHFTKHFSNPYLWALFLLRPSIRHYFTFHFGGISKPPGFLVRQIKKYLFNRYDRVFGVCQYVVDNLRIQGCSQHVSALMHFINTDRFRPDPAAREAMRKEHGAEDHFVVLVVAYLIRQKGVDLVIKALETLPENIKLWIVGAGEESGNLAELCRDLNVSNRVVFFGYQQNIQRFTQAADCFVCPSRGVEAAPLVVVEAQSSGVPVIGSRNGGIPEYISDTKTGFIFPQEDYEQLAEHLRTLYENPSLLREIKIAAREWIINNFSHLKQIEKHVTIYTK